MLNKKLMFIFMFVFILLLGSVSATSSLNTDLVSYWKLDNNILTDELGKVNLTNSGTIDATGKILSGRSFDGSNDYLNSSVTPLNSQTEYTLSAWVKPSTATDEIWMIMQQRDATTTSNQYYLFIKTDGTVWMLEYDTSQVLRVNFGGSVNIRDNNWHNVVFIRKANNASLYIDGVLDESSAPTQLSTISADFAIGYGKRGTRWYFEGIMDEISVWDRALTIAEKSELFNSGVGKTYPFIVSNDLIAITLNSPANNTLFTNIINNFTATFTPTFLNLTNATYNVWDSNDTLFNSTTVSLSGSVEINNTLIINNFTMDNYKWGVSACGTNSTGFVNCSFYSLNYTFEVGAAIINQTYNNDTYETLNESFTSYVQSVEGVSFYQAYLYYNGTKYIASLTNIGNNIYYLSKTIDIPLINSTEDVNFFWQFIFTSPIQRTQNTTAINQTINLIYFGPCNGTYTNLSLNITIKNEANFSLINSSLEFNADYYLGTGTLMKTLEFKNTDNNVSNFQFCIFPSTKSFYLEDILSYYAPDHERREYFLDQATLTSVVQNLALYLLPTVDTSVFTVRVIDEDENNLEGVFVRVQRWDIGTNNFYTIGMIKTTSDGTGIINLRLNDAWYRYQVIYNDVLVKTTEPTKESSTERVIQVSLSEDNPYDQFDNIDYDLNYDNDTNITSLTYADTSGSVQTGCLKIIELTGLGKNEIYYSCVESTSGVLSYPVPTDGTYIIRAIFILTDEYGSIEKVVDEIFRQGEEERFGTIGVSGAFASLLLIGTAGLIGVSAGSIPLGIGLIVASLVIVNLIGWLNISLSVIISLVSIFILILFNMGKKQ